MGFEVEQVTESQDDKATTTNNATGRVEGAVSDRVSIAMANANVNLNASAANKLIAFSNLVFVMTGANTAIRELQLPNSVNGAGKVYVVENATSGGFDVRVIRALGGTGILVPPGQRYLLFNDHTNVVFLSTSDSTGAPTSSMGLLKYAFDSSTVMADPGTGDVRFNNATPASATAAAISDTDLDGVNRDAPLDSFGSFRLLVRDAANPAVFAFFDVTAASTDNGAWHQLALSHIGSNGSFTNGGQVSVHLFPVESHDRLNWMDENLQSGDYTLVAGDAGKAVVFTGASPSTFEVPDAATLLRRAFTIFNAGTADLTLESATSPAQEINGGSSVTLAAGQAALLWTDGVDKIRAFLSA